MLQPLVRRTWAPRGQTPEIIRSSRHDRISVITAITISPKRRRLGLYFAPHRENINAEKSIAFLRQLRRQTGTELVVVWDRLNAHRTAARILTEQSDAFRFHWLPPYAPELNPVEQVWSHAKCGPLANLAPSDVDELHECVCVALDAERQSTLLHSYFRHAGLKL